MDFYIINIGTFLFAITILTITPGLDTALVIRNTIRAGKTDGCITSLGICCGLFLHATLSAIGVSAILKQSAELFHFIKLIGAAYLIYLGVSGLIAIIRNQIEVIDINVQKNTQVSIVRSFREGLLSNILNPKTAIFYLAFLPQFIHPDRSPFLQSIYMATIHFVISMAWQCMLAFMIHSTKNWIQNASVIRGLESCTAFVLIALGIKLALDRD